MRRMWRTPFPNPLPFRFRHRRTAQGVFRRQAGTLQGDTRTGQRGFGFRMSKRQGKDDEVAQPILQIEDTALRD